MDKAETALCFIDLYEQEQKRELTVNIEGEARAPPRVTVEKTYDDNREEVLEASG